METRIVIFGNSGSGKSTLAKQLSHRHQLQHVDLDTYAWQPAKGNKPPTRSPIEEVETTLCQELLHTKNWVIEGCYSDILALVLPNATKVYFLNLPIASCIENAKARPWEPHKYPSKQAQDENLNMLIQWISQYQDRTDEFSYLAHRKLFDQFNGVKELITQNRSVRQL
ncbi:AAA family ATPase [Thalassotalea atypica]|uniref:AAA family ATPase n=1 Tax=Thalassotalea atypica TaxID=2054316 RepID=UPI0025724697|nr:AAA family ATPase [Thalassotalea atypica]